MKHLKKYKDYKESLLIDLSFQRVEDLMESLTIWHDALLLAVGAEETNIFDTLKLPQEDFGDNLDLDFLSDSIDFINSLYIISLFFPHTKYL